jgi:hypothetical protein
MTGIKRVGLGLIFCTQLTQAVEPMSRECQQAFSGLKTYIELNSANLSQAELETSQAADTVRLACDGTDRAYQQSMRQIAARFIPPPRVAPAGLSETTEGVLTLALMIALITASSGGVVVIGGGNGLIIAPQ